tara:strand:+ start:2268 stop:3518 length:1251 start_codon:yes stop_codon:yes gene_type:complete
MENTNVNNEENEVIEDELLNKFESILLDFTNDLQTTFPECEENIKKLNVSANKEKLYKYCKKQFCPHFFNILYKNEEMFEITEEKGGLYFLPLIDFKQLFNENISDNTKDIMWNYLQLMLFTCVKDVNDTEMFGETSKLFEAIDSNQLQEKLMETMNSLNDAFQDMEMKCENNNNEGDEESNNNNDESEQENKKFNFNDFKDFMNPEDLNSHLSGIMDGKIGQLAKEIAGEAMETFDMNDLENNEKNAEKLMKDMFKDPSKLMKLVKQIGGKIDKKMKDGSINKDELVKEAGEIMEKIQDIPGLKNVMSQMGMKGNGKMDFKGMMNRMQSTMNNAKTKDRMREKLKKRQEEEKNKQSNPNLTKINENNYAFRPEMNGSQEGFMPFMDEPVMKSSKRDKPTEKKKGKKKGKKGKSKK